MRALGELVGRQRVILDTMVFIYYFEDAPKYGARCEALFAAIAADRFTAAFTPCTAGELLVKPLQLGRQDTADAYRAALRSMRNVEGVALTTETGYMAGALRAKYRLAMPDCIQAATALQQTRPTLITNDSALQRIREVDVFLLDKMDFG